MYQCQVGCTIAFTMAADIHRPQEQVEGGHDKGSHSSLDELDTEMYLLAMRRRESGDKWNKSSTFFSDIYGAELGVIAVLGRVRLTTREDAYRALHALFTVSRHLEGTCTTFPFGWKRRVIEPMLQAVRNVHNQVHFILKEVDPTYKNINSDFWKECQPST